MNKSIIPQIRERLAAFDAQSATDCKALLKEAAKWKLKVGDELMEYADVLLFVLAYAPNVGLVQQAEKELKRISNFLKKATVREKQKLENSGLPFTPITTRFSHECCEWLQAHQEVNLEMHHFDEASKSLSEILKFTLPPFERDLAVVDPSDDDILRELGIPTKNKLSFILKQFDELNDRPQLKDDFFDALGMTVRVLPKSEKFSRLYNRIPVSKRFEHSEILRKFDHMALLNQALPEAKKLSETERSIVIDVIKKSMTLTARETDPATYLDPSTLRLYELERGISIAHYTMTINRKLPLEYYIGFTLFKNGLPASYGGAWVFGKRALFGINVFEAYRGGESGYIMCQLLRSYRQAYGVDYFEVEPYQYGADNPDGIKSGAFWFYYRYGFRPLDQSLNKLAESEFQKIKSQKGYRSSERTLLRFIESNIALNLGNSIPLTVPEVAAKITNYIIKNFGGDRRVAISQTVDAFRQKNKINEPLTHAERLILEEVAMVDAVNR